MKKEKKKLGRPSKYSEAVCDKICRLIGSSNKGLHVIIKENPELPSYGTIFEWLSDERYKSFHDKYTRAREDQASFLADEIIEIADDSSEDIRYDRDGNEIVNHDHIQRSRLRVDARKWKASKLAPKKYSDKIDVTTDGKELSGSVIINPVIQVVLSNTPLASSEEEVLSESKPKGKERK